MLTQLEPATKNNQRYSINEIFGPTIQGEGSMAGSTSHFVRFNGCDYRCKWCDSWEAVDPELIKSHHTAMTAGDITSALKSLRPARWITLSGGNPALVGEMRQLIDLLHKEGWLVNCETQGTKYQPWFETLDQLTLSPKPPSSGMETDWEQLRDIYFGEHERAPHFIMGRTVPICVKVVVFDEIDLDYASVVATHLRLHEYGSNPLYLQVGTPRTHERAGGPKSSGPSLEEMVADYQRVTDMVLAREGLVRSVDVRVLPQLHLYLFGHGRGV